MKTLLTCISLFISLTFYGQNNISGRVTDKSGDPLIGANIFIPSTYEGSTSDLDGKFKFTSSLEGEVLIHAQYLGYLPDSQIVTLPMDAPLEFRLRESINKLAEVVVTAGAMEASDTRKTAVLSSIDVVTTGATGDLVEALSVLPGSTPAGETGQLLVRGGAASETQAFINGLRVPKFYTSNVPDVASRSRFNPFDFKGITFATGGFSAQYGDALSAALLLQSNNLPDQDRWSVGLMTLGANVGHTNVWDKQAFSIAGTYTNLSLYKLLSKSANERFLNTPESGIIQTGYWWENKKGGLLRVYAQGSTTAYSGIYDGEEIFYGGNKLSLNNTNIYSQAVYQQAAGENGIWEIGTAYAVDWNGLGIDDFSLEDTQDNWQVRAKRTGNLWEIAKWTAGGSWQTQRGIRSGGSSEIFEWGRTRRYSSAGFAEADWYFTKQWVLRTGVRYDHFSGAAGEFSPRFQFSHLFNANHQIALSAGRYLQRDIPADAFNSPLNIPASRADHLMLTYFKNWKKRLLRAEVYYKKYDNLVTRFNAPDFEAFGEGFARGVDVFYRDRRSFKNGDLWVSLSLIDSKRSWLESAEIAPVPFSARQVVSVVYKHFFPKPSMGISLTYRWHTGRPYHNPNIPGNFQETSPHFHDLSANISYLTNIKGHFTVLFISMTNVPNFNQVHTYRYAMEPNMDGIYPRTEVRSLFPSFPFVGMFMNINEKKDDIGVDDL